MQTVLFIEAQMKQYRAPFYEQLNQALRHDGLTLTVAYSAPPQSDVRKHDTCELPQHYGRQVPGWWLWPNRLLFQPVLGLALRSDLVIIDQGNKFLLNHLLLQLARLGSHRVALWGHGRNHRPGQIAVAEWYRCRAIRWSSWWFAYTEKEAEYLVLSGVPATKITVIDNSIDTRKLRDQLQGLRTDEISSISKELQIPQTAKTGIFCGMLDESKGVRFLIEASQLIKARVSDFHLIIVGGGRDECEIRRLAEKFAWIHVVGPRFGREKAALLAISDVFLLPGAVGLAILDAFASSLPLVTTKLPTHGPELEYLENGKNGMITEHNVSSYANAVASLLCSPEVLQLYKLAASQSCDRYCIENMALKFHQGILSCFGMAPSTEKFSTDFDLI